MAPSTYVFISYAEDTKPLAKKLAYALQREGIRTWADFKDLKPGQLWKDEVESALDKAQWFVILVSPHSQSTRWAEVEWRLALTKAWSDSSKVLIPVVVGGNEAPPFLRDWVSLRIDPDDEPAKWIADVLQVLRSARNRFVSGATHAERQARLNDMAREVDRLH
jgi:hypothetical protein